MHTTPAAASDPPHVVGLLLAAGAGTRFGRPKALITGADGRTWVQRSIAAMTEAGVAPVYVVAGAEREAVARLAAVDAVVVEAADWERGMGSSLRAGLAALAAQAEADAALIMLVDTPGVGPEVVRRLARHGSADALARATYDGEPGHPVVLGRYHWQSVVRSASGDRGARDYLRDRAVTLVECGDIGSGADIDTPPGAGPQPQPQAASEPRGQG